MYSDLQTNIRPQGARRGLKPGCTHLGLFTLELSLVGGGRVTMKH